MDRIRNHLEAVADSVRRHRDEIGAQFSQRLREAAPQYYAGNASDLQGAGWAALYVLIDGALRGIATGQIDGTLAGALANEASAAARADLPWDLIHRTYQLTHQVMWEAVIPQLVDLKIPRHDEALVLREASDVMFRYFGFCEEAARQVYLHTQATNTEHSRRRLLERVEKLLNGVAVPDSQIGYRLEQNHVAVVGWGDNAEQTVADAAVRAAAEMLVVPAGVGHFWAWLGCPAGRPAVDLRPLIPSTTEVVVAQGSSAFGRPGFAASHRQARLVASLAARKLLPASSTVTAFEEVALMSVVLEDESAARVFIAHELGALSSQAKDSQLMRRTLVALSRSSQNIKVAARMLGVSERTVRYRMAKLEQSLGLDFRSRLPELVAAVGAVEALQNQAAGRLG
jgi:hypothetical protein